MAYLCHLYELDNNTELLRMHVTPLVLHLVNVCGSLEMELGLI
jgi:hypothetical protein